MIPWLTVVTTPRRPQYLRGTLDALDAAGAADFPGRAVVFVDGDRSSVEPLVGSHWEIESLTGDQPSRGTRRSFFEIFHRAAGALAPYLLSFEDDVRVARNAIPAMTWTEIPDWAGFLSFLCMNPGGPTSPGIHRFAGHFWGSQALKIPGRSLAMFASIDQTPTGYPHAGDVWIGERLVPGIVLPAIVRHVGAESSIPSQASHTLEGEHAHRAGLHYVGDTADALQVLGLAAPP